MNRKKVGRHYLYPNSFIIALSDIKTYFHLPYLQTEGVINIWQRIELPDSPSYNQMNRKIDQFNVKIESKGKDDDVVIVIDNNGINNKQMIMELR